VTFWNLSFSHCLVDIAMMFTFSKLNDYSPALRTDIDVNETNVRKAQSVKKTQRF